MLRKAILILVISILVGTLGFVMAYVDFNGLLVTWSPLDGLPDKAVKIYSAVGDDVVVETLNHKYYSCPVLDLCWQEVPFDQLTSNGSTEFFDWPPSDSPRRPELDKVVDIKYVRDPTMVHWVIYAAYAVRTDGSVWVWRKTGDLTGTVLDGLLPICGAFVGFSLSAGAILILGRRAQRKSPKVSGRNRHKIGLESVL